MMIFMRFEKMGYSIHADAVWIGAAKVDKPLAGHKIGFSRTRSRDVFNARKATGKPSPRPVRYLYEELPAFGVTRDIGSRETLNAPFGLQRFHGVHWLNCEM